MKWPKLKPYNIPALLMLAPVSYKH